jgi:hypothetical protein
MRNPRLYVTASFLVLASAACGSKSGLPRGQDGAAGNTNLTSDTGGAGSGGKTGSLGGGSGSGGGAGGAAGSATGAGGSGTGGLVAGGNSGTLQGGAGGSPKDASTGDGPKDAASDAPLPADGGTSPTDVALSCPDHPPQQQTYPYAPESCSTELAASKLRCTYTAALPGADGGPACAQTFFCQCVSGQGGLPSCYWQSDPNALACPDAGAPPPDAARADAATIDATAPTLCGGKACTAEETCCGPAECGRCINKLTGPNCPSQCSTSYCGPSGAACKTGEICVDVMVSAGPAVGSATAKCVANPCGSQTLACSCTGTLCSDSDPQTACGSTDPTTGLVRCVGGNKCAAPDTPIATPAGNHAIADLRPGDLVYSEHDGALVAVPLVRVVRRPAAGHFVVHVVTARGAVLDISGPHPTADGRKFADLKIGDALDGDPIVVSDVVPYPHAFTYDILPASSTGTYLASGLLIGSTLR